MIPGRLFRWKGSEPSAAVNRRAPAAPHIDGDEEEQPDDGDEVPIPCGRFETEMPPGREVALIGPPQIDDQADRADQNVEAGEAGRNEEGRGIGTVAQRGRRRGNIKSI